MTNNAKTRFFIRYTDLSKELRIKYVVQIIFIHFITLVTAAGIRSACRQVCRNDHSLCGVLRQYRTKIVPQMRCQIFRQIVQKFRRHTDVCRGIFVQDDGKYASRLSDALRSEPKANAERFRELMQSSGAKPQGGLCAVLP